MKAKANTMKELIDEFTREAFGRTGDESHATQTCVICGGEASYFKDELSRKEYNISKMCQKCQDDVFG